MELAGKLDSFQARRKPVLTEKLCISDKTTMVFREYKQTCTKALFTAYCTNSLSVHLKPVQALF